MDFSYENAEPLSCDLPEFRIRIEGGQAVVEPKQHFATAEEALRVVAPVLQAWELDAALTRGPDVLRFVEPRPVIVDRAPPRPGVVQMGTGVVEAHSSVSATIRLSLNADNPSTACGPSREPGSGRYVR